MSHNAKMRWLFRAWAVILILPMILLDLPQWVEMFVACYLMAYCTGLWLVARNRVVNI